VGRSSYSKARIFARNPTVLPPAPAAAQQPAARRDGDQLAEVHVYNCERAETELEGDYCFSPFPITEAEVSYDYILSAKTGNICLIFCLAAAVSAPLGWKRSPFLTQQM